MPLSGWRRVYDMFFCLGTPSPPTQAGTVHVVKSLKPDTQATRKEEKSLWLAFQLCSCKWSKNWTVGMVSEQGYSLGSNCVTSCDDGHLPQQMSEFLVIPPFWLWSLQPFAWFLPVMSDRGRVPVEFTGLTPEDTELYKLDRIRREMFPRDPGSF